MSQVSVAQGLLHSAETLHRDRVAGAIPEGCMEERSCTRNRDPHFYGHPPAFSYHCKSLLVPRFKALCASRVPQRAFVESVFQTTALQSKRWRLWASLCNAEESQRRAGAVGNTVLHLPMFSTEHQDQGRLAMLTAGKSHPDRDSSELSQEENPPSATWPLFCLPGSFAVTCDTAGNVARTWGGDTSDNVLSAPVPPADPSLDRLTSSHTHIQPLTSAVSQKQRRKTLVGCDSPFIVNSRRHTRTAIDGAREPRPAQCKPTRAQ
ncbi:uncharacterized protein ACIBXB_018442 isoform 2-T2 [Morphnus guianensis]